MKRLRIALAAFAALVLGGCGGDSIQSPDFTQVLLRLAVTAEPAQPAGGVPVGRTQQFVARGEYSLPPGSNPATDIRPDPVEGVAWSSSNPAVATIDPATGLATALSVGTTTIRAVGDDAEGTTLMTVSAAVVESITITLSPNNTNIPVGGSRVATANGVLSDGTTQPVIATWTSSDTQRVTVGPGPSTTTSVQAQSVGNSTLTATSVANPSVSGQLQVTVQQRVVSLTVVPDSASTPLGRPFQFTVTGTGQNSVGGGSVPLVPGDFSVVWSVVNSPAVQAGSAAPVAGIDPATGVANGVRVGTATVTATAAEEGISDSAALQITPPVLDRIVISPANPSIPLGAGVELTATGVFTNGVTSPQRASWSLENSAPAGVVTFNPNPTVTTTATGAAIDPVTSRGTGTIRASAVDANGLAVVGPDGLQLTATTGVTVTNAVIVPNTLAVRPATATVTENRTVTFTAIVEDTAGNEVVLPATAVTWASSDTAIATINANTGVATGVLQGGPVTITATGAAGGPVAGETATAVLRVTDDVCTTPLLVSEGVLAQSIIDPVACAGCFINNPLNFIDGDPDSFSTIFAALGLLGGEATLRAQTQDGPAPPRTYPFPFPGGDNAGFVIARPTGTLVLAEVFSQLQVRTARNGVVVETSGGPRPPPGALIPLPLRVDLLGQDINGEYDLALVSIRTSVPYDAVDLTFNSGTATALSDVLVFQACGTAELPVVADLVSVERIEPVASTLAVGGTRDYVLLGRYSNGLVAPIPDADIDWVSLSTGTATIATNGLVTGVAPGTATITATLKPGVPVTGTPTSAQATVTVVANLCTAPLLASDTPAATIFRTINGICLLCTTSELPNVIDDPINTFGSLNVPVGLLNAGVSVTVRANETIAPVAGNRAGFIISRPTNNVVEAELLSQITVQTLLNGVVVSTSGPVIPLRLGLLGVDLGGGEQLVVSTPAATPFDAVRLTFSSGLLGADLDQLGTINMFRACSTVALP